MTAPEPSGHPRLVVLLATSLITLAGGAMDAWVYLDHGHVFANAQSGNVVLMGLALARFDVGAAATHLPSLIAFIGGMLASQSSGRALKRAKINSRLVRLCFECVLLLALAPVADRLPNRVVTSCVGFIAGLQITSLSHFGSWAFNTGMTTGNLRAATNALSNALSGRTGEWPRAIAMTTLCVAFAAGAVVGAWLAPHLGGLTLLPIAGFVALAAFMIAQQPDPLPEWKELC